MDKQNYAAQAVESVRHGKVAFAKFLSANDTGKTGGHQAGIYISKKAISLIFDAPFQRGENHDRWARIRWQNDILAESRFIYYGAKTRDEYRITNCATPDFNPLASENTGAILVLVKKDAEDYEGWILNTDEEIEDFLAALDMNPAELGGLIGSVPAEPESIKEKAFAEFAAAIGKGFPETAVMAETARQIHEQAYDHIENIIKAPDKELLEWVATEYELFRYIESAQYGGLIRHGFSDMQQFISVANTILNRRKSRAGKSFENHLEAIFKGNHLTFDTQVITEERKKPDFVFPGGIQYHNPAFDADKLIVLGAKTTCKDRWRQILNEADRVRRRKKYLATLQQGVSAQQMEEMHAEQVVLVVPSAYITKYPVEWRSSIMSLRTFIEFVKEQAS